MKFAGLAALAWAVGSPSFAPLLAGSASAEVGTPRSAAWIAEAAFDEPDVVQARPVCNGEIAALRGSGLLRRRGENTSSSIDSQFTVSISINEESFETSGDAPQSLAIDRPGTSASGLATRLTNGDRSFSRSLGSSRVRPRGGSWSFSRTYNVHLGP
jgi:hypothetical protein